MPATESSRYLNMLKENEARIVSFLIQLAMAAGMSLRTGLPYTDYQRTRAQVARALSRSLLGYDGLGNGIFRTLPDGTVLPDSGLAGLLNAAWLAGAMQAVAVHLHMMERWLSPEDLRAMRTWARSPFGAPVDGARATILRSYDHPMRRDYLDGRMLDDRVRQIAVDLLRKADEAVRLGLVMGDDATGIAARLRTAIEADLGIKRLVRTEIASAYGSAFKAAAALNPVADPMVVDWVLHPKHGCCDNCDVNAIKGPYPLDAMPPFPGHPGCMCHLRVRPLRDKAEILRVFDQLNGYQTPVHPAFVTSLLKGR